MGLLSGSYLAAGKAGLNSSRRRAFFRMLAKTMGLLSEQAENAGLNSQHVVPLPFASAYNQKNK